MFNFFKWQISTIKTDCIFDITVLVRFKRPTVVIYPRVLRWLCSERILSVSFLPCEPLLLSQMSILFLHRLKIQLHHRVSKDVSKSQ